MKKILVVDDASYMRLMLKKIIPRTDFEIIGEASGKTEAIKKFTELKPDLVTLDLSLSGSLRDGVDVLAQFMAINPEAIVIIISATSQGDLMKECLALGARNFVTKPIETASLLEILALYK